MRMRMRIYGTMSTIRKVRKELLKISQAELAEMAGVTQSTVSRWERGELSPSLDEVARLIASSAGRLRPSDFLPSTDPREAA